MDLWLIEGPAPALSVNLGEGENRVFYTFLALSDPACSTGTNFKIIN